MRREKQLEFPKANENQREIEDLTEEIKELYTIQEYLEEQVFSLGENICELEDELKKLKKNVLSS